jgi:hypothetical protein
MSECVPDDEPARLLIGQDHSGLWVVREAGGRCGGLFINRDEAERYARAERMARLPRATDVVAVDSLEFDAMFSTDSPHAA